MTINLPVRLPDWVKYIATDEDGELYGFSGMPVLGNGAWKRNGHRATWIVDTDIPEDHSKELYKITNGNLERVGSE